MEILLYQITIFITLVLTRYVAPRLFLAACLVWTAFTAVNLFWPPLIVLQLFVIWGTFCALEPPKPTPNNSVQGRDRPNGNQGVKEKADKPPNAGSLTGASATETVAPLPVRKAEALRPGPVPDTTGKAAQFFNNVNRLIEGANKHLDQELAVQAATKDMRLSYYEEQLWLTRTLEEAESTLQIEKRKERDPHFAELYEENYKRISATLNQTKAHDLDAAPDNGKLACTDFALPPPHPNHDVNEKIKVKYHEAIEEYSRTLSQCVQKLQRIPGLREIFEKKMLSRGGGDILKRMQYFESGNEWRYPSRLVEGAPEASQSTPEIPPLIIRGDSAAPAARAPAKGMNLDDIFRTLLIKQRATSIGVPFLIHFTRARNLQSILEHGLCSTTKAKELGITPYVNDRLRLDGRPDAISLSIAFPNHRMFFKYRQEEPNEQWVVLLIEPAVLWRKKCGFCQRNAADHRIRERPVSALMNIDAFDSMFKEMDGVPARTKQGLFDYDPTDPQAEVLVFDTIEPKSVIGAAFDDARVANAYSHLRHSRQWKVFPANRGLFASRDFARKTRN